mmetsp:Transcript_9228/g.26511  ORF Transcript_9228/g.26511 Transcript_9228/m.26511 type:complete len:201 (-) Transcript_9228:413-1015(-)
MRLVGKKYRLRGGLENDLRQGQDFEDAVSRDFHEMVSVAKAHGFSEPKCHPAARRDSTFEGGDVDSFDDPRLSYLSQVMEEIQQKEKSSHKEYFPGDVVQVTIKNGVPQVFNATVVSLPFILSREIPVNADALLYRYDMANRRFVPQNSSRNIMIEHEFVNLFYPDLDRSRFGQFPCSLEVISKCPERYSNHCTMEPVVG